MKESGKFRGGSEVLVPSNSDACFDVDVLGGAVSCRKDGPSSCVGEWGRKRKAGGEEAWRTW